MSILGSNVWLKQLGTKSGKHHKERAKHQTKRGKGHR
jgi:hypothetical protein